MNELKQNILLEIIRGIVTCAGWWVLFYKMHRPSVKARQAVMLISFPVFYILWRYCVNKVILFGGLDQTVSYSFTWALGILFFALVADNRRSAIFTAVYYIVSEQIVDVTRMCAIGWIRGGWFPYFTIERYMQYILQYLFMLGWAVWFYRVMKGQRRDLPPRVWVVNLVTPAAVFFLLTHFDTIALPLLEEQGINLYGIGTGVGLIFFLSHHYSFYLYIRQMELFDLKIQTQILQSEFESQRRQNTLIAGAQKQSAEIRHEMKNLLFVLQTELDRGNSEGVKNRIDALLGELKQYEQKPYTAVPVIDAMISYKRERLREYNADFSVNAEPLYTDDALAYDIASILAIALDNAGDAARYAFESRDYLTAFLYNPDTNIECFTVRLVISRRKNLVLIWLSNPLARPLVYRNGELQSAKEDPGHGVGLPALRRIVERYSGETRISGKDGVFTLEVMLMCPEPQNPLPAESSLVRAGCQKR